MLLGRKNVQLPLINPGSMDKICVETAVVWMVCSQQEAVVDKRGRTGKKKGIEGQGSWDLGT